MLDLKDKKILYQLEQNSRISETELAKRIGASKQVVKYRINRLLKEGIIIQFQTAPNFQAFDKQIYATIYFKLTLTDEEIEKKIINSLITNKNVAYVASTGGRFDAYIVIITKTFDELDKKLNEATKGYEKYLSERLISIRTMANRYPRSYLLSEKKIQYKRPELLSAKSEMPRIKERDKKILKLLSENSRITLVDINKKTNIPITTIRERINFMIKNQIISHFPLHIDVEKAGYQNYKLFIFSENNSTGIDNAIQSFAENNPNITWFHKTISEWVYELRIEVEDQTRLQSIIRELRNKLQNKILKIEILTIFKDYKDDFSTVLN